MEGNKTIHASFTKIDADEDGVTDLEDQCPDTPAGVTVNEFGYSEAQSIYLDENGVTIKARSWAQAGDTGELNGTTYTIVDEATLREMAANQEDVTRVVTTLVTDMSELFYDQYTFNQDISSWDVSNVTDISYIFSSAYAFNQNISNWDVSKVTNMEGAFYELEVFDQPLND